MFSHLVLLQSGVSTIDCKRFQQLRLVLSAGCLFTNRLFFCSLINSSVKQGCSLTTINLGAALTKKKDISLKRSAMEFTDEEKIWLQRVSAEIPEGNELTAKEKQLQEKAKPETEFQAQIFQTMASIQFGLNDLITSTIEVKNSVQQRSSVSSQCG